MPVRVYSVNIGFVRVFGHYQLGVADYETRRSRSIGTALLRFECSYGSAGGLLCWLLVHGIAFQGHSHVLSLRLVSKAVLVHEGELLLKACA